MTSEKRLREIAAWFVRAGRECISDDIWGNDDFHNELTESDLERVGKMVRTYPILDLPVPDRNGCFWPAHGRSYACVRRGTVYQLGDPVPGVVIVRGGPGESSRHTSIALTREEALELASLLTAAAMEEA